MYFRQQLEKIMADASLSDLDKNLLVEKLTLHVLAYDALAGLEDVSIKSVLKKLDDAGRLEELKDLLKEKTKFVDTTPTDNIYDDVSMVQ